MLSKFIAPRALLIGGLLSLLIGGVLLMSYCGASSKTNIPKADQYATNANVSEQRSVNAETEANTINTKSQAVEAKRQTVNRELADRTVADRVAENKLNQRKAEYEKVKNTKPVVNADDLDGRERGLLAELRRLYQ